MPQPSLSDIRRFCEIDGWEELARVRGGTGDHHRFRKVLDDGTILRTKVSHGAGEIGDPGLWHHIWREQLGLETEEQFWEALRSGEPVPRGAAAPDIPAGPSLPAWVVAGLLREGVPEGEVRRLDEAEARRRLEELWSRPSADDPPTD